MASSTFNTAYEVSRHIQSFVSTDFGSESKLYASYEKLWRNGPNPFYCQTTKGLVLEVQYDVPSALHTPYGKWVILNGSGGFKRDWDELIDTLKEDLGLIPMEPVRGCTHPDYPRYAITKWQWQTIEMAEYAKDSDAISYENVRNLWAQFKANHPDLQGG